MSYASRRGAAASLLTLLALAGGCSASLGRSPASLSPALAPLASPVAGGPREQTPDEQVQQVLNRLAFGPRPGDVTAVRAAGVDAWVARQLAPERMDDSAATRVLASYEMLNHSTPDLMTMYRESQATLRTLQKQSPPGTDSASKKELRARLLRNDPTLADRVRQTRRVLGEVQSARLARAVVSDRQLQEVMTDFWENHFTVYAGKGLTRYFIPAYDRDVIRPLALGHFRDLLGAVAKSPAMLFFLDQWQSAADSTHPTLRAGPVRGKARGVNENYARELMELHTVGVDGGYTQHDVIDVARALTGWTMAPRQGAGFVFRPQIHDAGEKTVLGHRLAAGRGIQDGEEVLDILARDPHTARFIATKLAVRFVSDEPPAALIDRATNTFRRTDGDIREVVRTIVTSPEFFSRAAYRSKVKSPFELVASALRAVGAGADTTMRSTRAVALLGQPLFGHQGPDGWPETGAAWMNAGAILNRINFGLSLAGGQLPGAGLTTWPDAASLRSAPRSEQVDAVVSDFLGGHASARTRDILVAGDNPAKLTGLAQVVGLAIGAPEFQRR